MQRAYDILEYHSYIRQVQGGKSGKKGLIWVNPSVLQTDDTKEYHNYPNQAETVENTETEEGEKEAIVSPNDPNTVVVEMNEPKEERQESTTTPASHRETEKNSVTKVNYTMSQIEYKVEKI